MKLEDKIKEKSEYNLNYNKLSDEINFDKYTNNESIFTIIINYIKFKKAFVIASLVILFTLSLILLQPYSENPSKPKPPMGGNTDEVVSLSKDEASLIGIAAYYEFDNKKQSKLSNVIIDYDYNKLTTKLGNQDVNGKYLKASYPYDYVKIISAYKFTIFVNDIKDNIAKEIIENGCGLGEVEVIVADFETYIDRDGQLQSSVRDTLVSLRGYNGYYTILNNSASRREDYWKQIFSSHKTITEDEINKDFTPPILLIVVEEYNNQQHVYFESSEESLQPKNYTRDVAFKNVSDVETVISETLYSVFELAKIPTKKINVKVIEIDKDKKKLSVESEDNLKWVYYSKYTEGISIENITIGDIITIEYDFLFEDYNPTSVTANSININELGGENNEKEN